MPDTSSHPAVVIDNGSGFTKVGFAGSAGPQDTFQTAIGRRLRAGGNSVLDDLNFVTGTQDDMSDVSTTHKIQFPVKNGIIDDWNSMEELWQTCIYDKLRCNPEDHHFLLTEPPLNTPENREQTAEIMFETFNIPGMCISVQAILALATSWTNDNAYGRQLTGTVIDSVTVQLTLFLLQMGM